MAEGPTSVDPSVFQGEMKALLRKTRPVLQTYRDSPELGAEEKKDVDRALEGINILFTANAQNYNRDSKIIADPIIAGLKDFSIQLINAGISDALFQQWLALFKKSHAVHPLHLEALVRLPWKEDAAEAVACQGVLEQAVQMYDLKTLKLKKEIVGLYNDAKAKDVSITGSILAWTGENVPSPGQVASCLPKPTRTLR